MTKLWIVGASLGLLILTSCAATWTLQWHSPTQDDNGTCAAPALVPTAGGLIRHIVTRNGVALSPAPANSAPGALNAIAQTGASGVYRYIVIEADSLGNQSCPDTLDILIRGSKFAVVTDLTVR